MDATSLPMPAQVLHIYTYHQLLGTNASLILI